MTNQKKLIVQLNKLINMECKVIKVHKGAYFPTFTVKFGKITLSYFDKNQAKHHLSREYDLYLGSDSDEYCAWRVTDKKGIIASNAIENQKKQIITLFNSDLRKIIGKKLISCEYNPITNDLKFEFEDTYCISVINIVAKRISKYKYYKNTEIFCYCYPGHYISLYADGRVKHGLDFLPKYVTDYEEHPEKYIFE